MKTLKNLGAKMRKLLQGSPRRQPRRPVPPGLEVLERREVPASQPIALANWAQVTGYSNVVSISTARDVNGNLDIFAVAPDHSVWYQSQSASGFRSNWTGLSGGVLSLSAIRDSNGNMDVFAIATDQSVWYRSQSKSGAWGNWGSLGGKAVSVSTGLDVYGNVDVFAVSTDRSVWYRSQSPAGAWSGWNGLGGGVLSLSVIRDTRGNMDVFAVAPDHTLWCQSQLPGGAWGGWYNMGYVLANYSPLILMGATSISTTLDGNGNVDLFALASDQVVYELSQSPSGAWGSWYNMGGGGVTSISTCRDSSGTVGVFATVTDNSVYYQVQSPGGAWSGWMHAYGGVTSVSAVQDPAGNLGVVAIAPDNSVWYKERAAYSNVSGWLFNPNTNLPSYLDVHQGVIGDCWLLASLAEVAARNPQAIKNMFTDRGTNLLTGITTYTVRFYDSAGVAHYFDVDTQLPAGGGEYDNPVGGAGAINGSPSPVLWVALGEKAYAEANAAGLVTTGHVGINYYDALDNGGSEWALQAITGHSASVTSTDAASAWTAGQYVVLNTGTPTSTFIVPSHCYAVVGYHPSSGTFDVFNPWGTDSSGWAPGYSGKVYGLFWANAPFLSQNFASQSVTSVAAAPGGLASRTRSADGLADLAFIAGMLEPHSKTRAFSGAGPTAIASVN